MNRLAYWKKYLTNRKAEAECKCQCEVCRGQQVKADQDRMVRVVNTWKERT